MDSSLLIATKVSNWFKLQGKRIASMISQLLHIRDNCIHLLFEDQVERSPDSLAVMFEDQKLTYRELNSRANQVAHYLKSLGVKPEMTVGIYLDRSIEMIIGLLGVLKAGGAYLPFIPKND